MWSTAYAWLGENVLKSCFCRPFWKYSHPFNSNNNFFIHLQYDIHSTAWNRLIYLIKCTSGFWYFSCSNFSDFPKYQSVVEHTPHIFFIPKVPIFLYYGVPWTLGWQTPITENSFYQCGMGTLRMRYYRTTNLYKWQFSKTDSNRLWETF